MQAMKKKDVMMMRKTTMNKYLKAFLTSILVVTVPSAIAGGHLTNTTPETNRIADETTTNLPAIHDLFLLKIQELMEQGLRLEDVHTELSHLTRTIETDIQLNEKTSMPLKDFSTKHLFSCRGLA